MMDQGNLRTANLRWEYCLVSTLLAPYFNSYVHFQWWVNTWWLLTFQKMYNLKVIVRFVIGLHHLSQVGLTCVFPLISWTSDVSPCPCQDSLRTKMQSLSWSFSLTMQFLSLSLLLKSLSLSWSLNKSPWSCPCDCVQHCIHIKIRLKVTYSY